MLDRTSPTGRVRFAASPMDAFAAVGWDFLQRQVGPLLEATAKPIPNDRNGCILTLGRRRLRIDWPDRIPGMKTWAGQQSLAKLVADRVKALRGLSDADPFAFEAACGGSSGMDPRNIDAATEGFGPDALGISVLWRPAVELLAVIGAELLPILVLPDGMSFAWYDDLAGCWMRFERVRRNEYYGRWSMATPYESLLHVPGYFGTTTGFTGLDTRHYADAE